MWPPNYRFADIIQSIPEKAAVVIGREWICHGQKDHLCGGPSQRRAYLIYAHYVPTQSTPEESSKRDQTWLWLKL
jgi:hypothetical protein